MRRGLASVAAGVAALTLAARLVGFGRWLVFSKTVGDTCLGDVYNATNQLPNVLFEVVAGGVLAGVVVPVVARHVQGRRQEAAAGTSAALLTWTALVLTPVALAAFLGARAYADAFVSGSCAGWRSTGAALVVMFVPQIWLYGVAVVASGVLQAHSRFVAAAAAPLVSSAVVITTYDTFALLAPAGARRDAAALTSGPLLVLGLGTTAGVLALALTTAVPLHRLGLPLRPRLRFAPGDAPVMGRIAAAGVAGLVVQQAATLLMTWTAKQTSDDGAVTRLAWANAIYLLPFAVLAAPLLQLSFPRLSAAAEQGAAEVVQVLDTVRPLVVLAGCLGAALLAGTAVPVARVFVLGPGSGRTAAMAGPIVALAPAVLGFSLLQLATRVLLAQHRARAAGLTTVVGWLVAVVGVLVVPRVLSPTAVVAGIGAAVSVGLLSGAVLGWWLTDRSLTAGRPAAPTTAGRTGRTVIAALTAAVVAAGPAAWVSRGLAHAPAWLAVVGGLGWALEVLGVFLLVAWLVDRRWWRLVRGLRAPA